MLYVKLNNGVEVPQLGLGVFQTKPGEETVNAVKWALEAGYRHIDTAKMYNNEESVAQGIREAGLRRKDVFITSKILPADIIAGKTAEGFDETLQKLGTDYVDLMLLHFPMLDEMNIAAWKTMVEYYRAGKARAIGISNYNEYKAGTNPFDPSDCLRITAFTAGYAAPTLLSFEYAGGHLYTLDATPSLTNETWMATAFRVESPEASQQKTLSVPGNEYEDVGVTTLYLSPAADSPSMFYTIRAE